MTTTTMTTTMTMTTATTTSEAQDTWRESTRRHPPLEGDSG